MSFGRTCKLEAQPPGMEGASNWGGWAATLPNFVFQQSEVMVWLDRSHSLALLEQGLQIRWRSHLTCLFTRLVVGNVHNLQLVADLPA